MGIIFLIAYCQPEAKIEIDTIKTQLKLYYCVDLYFCPFTYFIL